MNFALSGQNLTTAYVFADCYYSDNETRKASVWGGVNIFELDSENGPRLAARFVIKKGKYELEPADVDENLSTK